MMHLALLTLCTLLAAALPASAGDLTLNDSMGYTLDDGIMSREEMKEEANYIHRVCTTNPYQSLYFDCDCIAGAFFSMREKLGPMGDQTTMLDKVMNNKSKCANKVAIAGNAYQSCMSQSSVYRELEKDNPEYCTCVANKTAKDFAKSPMLNISYIESVTIGSMIYCNKPENRKPKTGGAGAPKIPN